MSVKGQKRKSRSAFLMSVKPPKADQICEKADIGQWIPVRASKRKFPVRCLLGSEKTSLHSVKDSLWAG